MSTSPQTVALEKLVDPERPITYGIVQPGPDVPDGIPYVRVVDMKDGTIVTETLRKTSAEIAKSYRRSSLCTGDLLISIRGHVGRTALVPREAAGANLTQDTARIAVSAIADTRYIRRAIEAPQTQQWLAKHTKGVAVRGINLADLRKLPIPLAPLPQQRRIADILDKADAIRRKRKQAIALTEELLRSTFLEMFGPTATGYTTWPVSPLEELAAGAPHSIRTGPFGSDLRHSEFVDEGVAVLGIDNAVQNRFTWNERRFITPQKYERLRRYTVFPNDVIVTIMGTTGRSAVVPEDIPAAITTKHLATITLDRSKAEPEFISQALFRHPSVLKQIIATTRGAIMGGLNLGLIKSLRLPVPPIARQREFTKITSSVRMLKHRLETAFESSNELFASLVQRAFSGDLAP